MGRSSDAPGAPARDTGAVNEPNVTELIQLGRDREAAKIGGGPMDVLRQLDTLGPLLAGTVGGITPDELDNETPCAAFTVRGVLEHMIGGATVFAAAFRGDEPPTPDTSDVLAGFGPALTGLAEAIQGPGALDRTVHAPFGDLPGETFARFVVLDGLVHGWDLATATGQAYDPPADLVAAVEEFAGQALAPLRDGDTFAAAVEPPAGATPIERLAAFTGRRV
jgi:uncharacterized protein (TIGR03086 family)